MTYKPFDVVTVPFPFTDRAQKKKRPALILSSDKAFNTPVGHSVMAMITSAKNSPWPLDVGISELEKTGLSADSLVRMKLFTLDLRFVLKRIGSLSNKDRKAVSRALQMLLGISS